MRKLRIFEHISLDGVIQQSADDGDFPYSDWTVAETFRVEPETGAQKSSEIAA